MAALRTRIYSRLDMAYVGGLSMSVWLYQAWGVCHLHLGLGRICLYCMHRGWSPSLVFVAVPAYSNMSLGWLSFAFTDRCRLCSVPMCWLLWGRHSKSPRPLGILSPSYPFETCGALIFESFHSYQFFTGVQSVLSLWTYCGGTLYLVKLNGFQAW